MPDYPNRASRNWGTYTYTQRQMIFASAATVMVANMSTPPLPPPPYKYYSGYKRRGIAKSICTLDWL